MKKKETLRLTTSKITILLVFCLFSLSSFAQDFNRHEFSIYGGGGLSTLRYKTSIGDVKLGLGGLVGLGYNFSFSPNWSINTGGELAFYNTKLTASSLTTSSRFYDGTRYWYDYVATQSQFEEKQCATFAQIPLTLQYQSSGETKFYASAGVKYAFSLNSKYDASANSLTTRGEIFTPGLPDPPASASGSFSNVKHKDELLLDKQTLLAAFEAGVKWPLSHKVALYTGAYVDYGLNKINALQLQPVVGYNASSPSSPSRNSVLNAPEFSDIKVNPLAVGLKLRLAIRAGQGKAPAPVPPPPPPAPRPPSITTSSLPSATQGSFYSTTLSATGDSPITWSIDSGSLSAGLSLNGNTISGTPTSSGASTFTVKATNAAGNDTKSFTITVNAPPAPPAPSQPSASELATLNAAVECFAFDSAVVPDGAKGLLDSKAEILSKYPNISIVVIGHTDNYGSDSVNDKLGKNRAESVKSYLVGKGVSGSRISTDTKGKKEPAVPNNTASNRCKNRRVMFSVR